MGNPFSAAVHVYCPWNLCKHRACVFFGESNHNKIMPSDVPLTCFTEEFKRRWLTSVIGFVLLCFGVWLLIWNEGRAVHRAHSLDEVYDKVIKLNPYEKIRSELDGHLVHITAPLFIDEPLTEPEYGISIQAVKLKRRVQMYQWVEERTSRDDPDNTMEESYVTSDYYYVTEWRDKLVDSSSFYIRHGHHNPTEFPLNTHVYVSPFVRVGHLTIGSAMKEKFTDFIEITSDERPDRKDVKLHMGIYYHCDNVWNPEVGDIRVQFYYAGMAGEVVSVVAVQKEGVLMPYTSSKGHEFAMVRHGHLNVNQMFHAEHFDIEIETWKLRAAGVFILYASSVCLTRIIKLLFLQMLSMRNMVTEDLTFPLNLAVALSLSLLIMAVIWLLYRPAIGVGLVAAAVSPFFYCTLGVYNPQNNGYIRQG